MRDLIHAKAYLLRGGAGSDGIADRLKVANPGSIVQVVRAGSIKNGALAEMLAAQTLRAEDSGDMLAKKPEVDLLLRVAGTTQIARAIKTHGAERGKGLVAINASRADLNVPQGLEGRELPSRPLSSQERLRIEKAALLNAERG